MLPLKCHHHLWLTNLIYLTFPWKQGLSVTQLPEDAPHRPHVHCLTIGSPEKEAKYYSCGECQWLVTTLSIRWREWWWWKWERGWWGWKWSHQYEEEIIMRGMVMGATLWEVVVQSNKMMASAFLMEMIVQKMVISERTALRSLVRNGERSGSREAEERWCWRERVFEWAAFKRCLNKCSRAFTKSGYSSEARWRSAVFELEWTFNAAKASQTI